MTIHSFSYRFLASVVMLSAFFLGSVDTTSANSDGLLARTGKTSEASYKHPEIDGLGFIRTTAVAPAGSIFKAQDDISLITTGNIVYISPAADGSKPGMGDRLFTFHTIDPVRDPDTGAVLGVQHVITGIIDIISIENEATLGRVVKAFREIPLQSQLMPYWRRPSEIYFREYPPAISGKVVKAADDQGLIARNTVVFIDKGSNDGLAAGDLFNIFHNDVAKPDPDRYQTIDLPPEHVGQLLVLHAEAETATAIIIDSKRPIIPGDRIGNPRQ